MATTTMMVDTRRTGIRRSVWEVAQVGAGNRAVARLDAVNLPVGTVVTASGRLSVAAEPSAFQLQYPFTTRELVDLDIALSSASRQSQARFAVYVGDLGSDTAARARDILADVRTPDNAVLLAVSPDQHSIEVTYGTDLRGRGVESAAPLGVSAAAAAFKGGNLIDGLISAVRVMSAAIARP